MSQLTYRQTAKQAENDLLDLLVKLASNIALIFARALSVRSPEIAMYNARKQAMRLIRDTIAGENGASPYSALLFYWILYAVYQVGIDQATFLAGLPEKGVSTGTPSIERLFATPDSWVDENGMRLQDRIDHVAQRTAQHFDRSILIILLHTDPVDLPAKIGSLFTIVPNRLGNALGFDAWRLLRHEMNRARGTAIQTAAAYNPYVEGVDWALSPKHPKMDHCDKVATIDMQGMRIKQPYKAQAVPRYPDHVYCLCDLQNAWVRGQKNLAYPDILNNPALFTTLITGQRAIPQTIIRSR